MFNAIRRLFRSLENPSTPFNSWARGPNVSAGVNLDEFSCLNHLPIYSAVNRIASDMALLDPQVVERQPNGSTRVLADNEIDYLLSVSPGGNVPAGRWRQAIFGHVLTWGNSYCEIEFDETWKVAGLWLLDPSRVVVEIDPTTDSIVYRYRPDRGPAVTLPPWKVLHFAGLGYDGLKGYSPIALCRETLALGMAADRFGASFFGNSARPGGILKHPGKLSDPAAKRIRQDLETLYVGPQNAGRIILDDAGLEFTPFSIPPDDAQFIETRKMGVEDVARLYGIPAHKIGGAPGGGSVEEQNIDYMQSTLLGLANMFEQEITLKLLKSDRRYRVTHDFKKLLKANATARAQYNATAIQWGWATRNRVAQDEGYEAYVGGDAPLLPLNMQLIDPATGNVIPVVNPQQPATPTTSATDSSSTAITALAGLVRSLVENQKPETTTDDRVTKAVEDVARVELQRASRREAAAITRAAGKPGFGSKIDELCNEHRSYLVEALGPSFVALRSVGIKADPESFADVWVAKSKADLVGLEAVTLPEQRPEAVEQLVTGWADRAVNTAWHTNDDTSSKTKPN